MSFLRRLGRLFTNEARAAVARLDDPAQSVADAYTEHLQLLHDVRERLAEVLTAQKKLEMQAGAIERTRERYRQEAFVSLGRGDEALARRALGRANVSHEQLLDLQAEIAAIHQTFLKIEDVAEELRVRTESIRHEKEIVAAKVAAARASITAHGTLGGFGPEMDSIRTLLADARDRTQSLEARAAAIEELVSRGTLDQSASLTPSDMTSRMRDATSETAIETALAALKQTMLTDGGPKPD